MYATRKSDLKRFTPNSESVCRIDEGNTNDFLAEPRAIEEFLKTIEPKYNAAVSVLESGRLKPQEIYVLAGFASYVMTCSPAAMRINSGPLQATLEATAKLIDEMGMFGPPPPELGGESLSDLLKDGKVKFDVDPKFPQAVGIAGILQRVAMFGNFKWDILINEHDDCPFFTSDYPVANENAPDPRVINRIIPFSPNVAVRFRPDINIGGADANFEFKNFSSSRRKVTRHEAVAINRSLVQCAEDAVFFRDDRPWIESFISKNRHFRIDTETVELSERGRIVQWSRQTIKPFNRENPLRVTS